MANGQFTFKLLDSEGNVLQTASNDSEGKIVFQPIQYTAEDHGKTFEYSIVEVNDNQDNYVYDRHTATVNVKVEDNGDGTMTVTLPTARVMAAIPSRTCGSSLCQKQDRFRIRF